MKWIGRTIALGWIAAVAGALTVNIADTDKKPITSVSKDAIVNWSPYTWKVTAPNGHEEFYVGEEPTFRTMIAGEWTVELWVQYAHEDPATGQPYVGYKKKTLTVGEAQPIFTDNFESGNLSAWNNP